MAWYDVFARFYDASLEPLYREQRIIAVNALDLRVESRVLDLPCGTGASFAGLRGQGSRVLGLDQSIGMVREANSRIAREAWTGISVAQRDARTVGTEEVAGLLGGRPDRLHVFLGTTVFDEPAETLAHLWDLLVPGGRAVFVDVHADPPGIQGRMVEWIARADLRRKAWEFLANRGEGFERRDLPTKAQHGGQMWLATATKRAERPT